MSRCIANRIAFLQACDREKKAAERRRARVADQQMGYTDRLLLSKKAYRRFCQTGDRSGLTDLRRRGLLVDPRE